MEEKVNIAQKWVVPKQLEKHGLSKKDISFPAATLKSLIQDYSREPGVRRMEQFISKLCRHAALEKVTKKKKYKKYAPLPKDLESVLGPKRFDSEKAQKPLSPGVVTGLAWTSFGGEILFIETLPLKGKGFKLTGQLGEVMSESANIAYSYTKKLLEDELDAQQNKKGTKLKDAEKCLDFLENHQVHLHLPAGATPKDGPSAGITMALALYSLAKNKKVKGNIAMTGELSLTGKVLPVGGVKEKVLAAKRAGIKTILLPKENEKDLNEVPEKHKKGLKFYPVEQFREVLKIAYGK
jgi:ATP-dependent Lon protease